MRYADEPLRRLLDDLSVRKPVPGGGSGCAAAAGLGAALGVMVANFSLGKGALPGAEEKVQELLGRLSAARDRFASLIDEDAAAYDGVRAARKAKAAPEVVLAAIIRAMEVPLGGVRTCHSTLEDFRALCPLCNPRLVTDLACGALLIEGALLGMAFNVRINLAEIEDAKIVGAARGELERLCRSAQEIRGAVLAHVEGHLGK